jgi:phage-related protein
MNEFTWNPDFQLEQDSAPSVTVTKYGDGYEARSPDGMNSDLKTWSLSFANRDPSEALAITSFFEANAAVTAFQWTDPDSTEPSSYKCATWKKTIVPGNLRTVTATFSEVAEP